MIQFLASEWEKNKELIFDGIKTAEMKNFIDLVDTIKSSDEKEDIKKILNDIEIKMESFVPKIARKKNRKNKNRIGSVEDEIDRYFKKLKKYNKEELINNLDHKTEFKQYYKSLLEIYLENIKDKLLKELDYGTLFEINASLAKRNNPIINIKKDYKTGNILIDTFSYVAEFQIPLRNNHEEIVDYLKIKIEPRDLIGRKMFKIMLMDIFEVGYIDTISGKEEKNEFIELYYYTYLLKLKNVLNSGIYREYDESEGNLRNIKGSIMIYNNFLENRFNRSKIYCKYDELDENNVINRLIVKAVDKIAKSPFCKSALIRSNANYILNAFFDDYQIILKKFKDCQTNNIIYNKQNYRFKEIIRYSNNILKNIGGTFDIKSDIGYDAFYIDMNILFESFIGKRVKKNDEAYINQIFEGENENLLPSSDYFVELQYDKEFLDDKKIFKIKPDILFFDSKGNPFLVADTKYKRLNYDKDKNYNIESSDVYQILAYAEKFNTKTAILIYPAPNGKKIEIPDFIIGNKKLIIGQVDLSDNNLKSNNLN